MKRLLGGATAGMLVAGLFLGCVPRGKGPERPGPDKPYELPKLPDTVWQPLVKTFEKQARGISDEQWKAVFAKYIAASKTPVRVAILDLVPDESAPRHHFVHSEAVSQVIRSLSCNGGAECEKRVYVHPRQPNDKMKADADRGSVRLDDLSLSLDDVSTALSAILDQQKPHERLVINVAIGLDPIKLTLPGKDIDSLINPLIKILKRASCAGALVIAPAGNLTGTDGPLIPAAFETIPAATATECQGLGIARSAAGKDEHAPKGEYAPLVYAVGGLDPLDQRLSIGRRWGQPRLAAFGMSVAAPGPASMPYSYPLSGTSMSAAIVAGVAAAVWSARPDLDAHQVMAHVYQGGVPLDGAEMSKRAETEFCVGHPLGPCADAVHRVFLCGALESALNGHFGCDRKPSTSYDAPHWPQSDRPPGPNPEPCAVTGCRKVFGPNGAQIPNGAVSQPYISGCPGCGIDKNLGRLSGLLSWITVPTTITSVVATSYAVRRVVIGSDASMTPWNPTDGFSFNYAPPDNLAYVILAVTFPDSNGNPQTEYQTVLPP